MGAYSTITITRSQAIERIVNALDEATNEELAEALFALTASKVLDNYSVVDDVVTTQGQSTS